MPKYINNKDMYNALVDYLDACKCAEERQEEIPVVPNYLAECFMMIASRLGSKLNFSGYSYLEDMKSEAVYNCLRYIRNFNPEKTQNPFAYFTEYVYNSFIRKINEENKNSYIKYKCYQHIQIEEIIVGEQGVCTPEYNEMSNNYIKDYEKKIQERLTKKRNRVKEKKHTDNTITAENF